MAGVQAMNDDAILPSAPRYCDNPPIGAIIKLFPPTDGVKFGPSEWLSVREVADDFVYVEDHLWLVLHVIPGNHITWTGDQWVMAPIDRLGTIHFAKARMFHSGNRKPWGRSPWASTNATLSVVRVGT